MSGLNYSGSREPREGLCRGLRGPVFSFEDAVSGGDGTLLVRWLE